MEMLEHITSYHLVNHLTPGLVLLMSMSKLKFIDRSGELLIDIIIAYFIGVLINRISSIIIEPILKKFKILERVKYEDYIVAQKDDVKIDELSEVCNMYRIYFTLILIIIFLNIFKRQILKVNLNVFLIAIGILLLFSIKKQSKYISKRVESK